jgi:hypothetical protein
LCSSTRPDARARGCHVRQLVRASPATRGRRLDAARGGVGASSLVVVGSGTPEAAPTSADAKGRLCVVRAHREGDRPHRQRDRRVRGRVGRLGQSRSGRTARSPGWRRTRSPKTGPWRSGSRCVAATGADWRGAWASCRSRWRCVGIGQRGRAAESHRSTPSRICAAAPGGRHARTAPTRALPLEASPGPSQHPGPVRVPSIMRLRVPQFVLHEFAAPRASGTTSPPRR